ncbi:hypothetical protein GIB67_030516 [Kingdonia uniflora]|uniref:GRF-type domain-containing protein n=1 Tax=Kingdonia uniflora TaxID=39325 RepID=A0A7J7LCU3_9MAGN|nr:hypothetical protein GIB67_030516 [Kingdonia uniflora]
MQNNLEASVRCLHNKAFPSNLPDNESSAEGFYKHGYDPQGVDFVEPKTSISSVPFSPTNEGYHGGLMYHQDFGMCSTFHPDLQRVQQHQGDCFDNIYSVNHEYPYPLESRVQYLPPFRMFFQGCYPQEFQLQEFQYFVVIDFEATCDKDKNPHPQEIIEFPSVLVNSVNGQIEASFQTYVRPAFHQHLTDFCKELTGIQQIQVDRGVSLSEALLMHDKWLEDKGIKNTNFAVVTWSNWDCRIMLESECRFKRIRKPSYFNRWINLKVPFNEVFGGVRCNLKEAVQLAGISWEGRPHCGLDDARNTARLLTNLMSRGFRFSITNSMACPQTGDRLMTPERMLDPPRKPMSPLLHVHPAWTAAAERCMYCYCGAKSSRCMVRKPGPRYGFFFFGCGNWTATRGAVCPYFEWASS